MSDSVHQDPTTKTTNSVQAEPDASRAAPRTQSALVRRKIQRRALQRKPDATGEEPITLPPGQLVKATLDFRLADTPGGSGAVKMVKAGDLLRIDRDAGSPLGHAYYATPMKSATEPEDGAKSGVLNAHYVTPEKAAAAPIKEPKLVGDFDGKFKGGGDEIRKSAAALKLVQEANVGGVKFGGYAEDGPAKAAWAYTVGDTVYVPKARTDIIVAMSDFLFELNNALRKPQFDENTKNAAAGKVDAKAFARRKVELEVEGMLRMGMIWFEIKGGNSKLDKYDGDFFEAQYADFKSGKKTKEKIVDDVLKWKNGIDSSKTNEEFYMAQYPK